MSFHLQNKIISDPQTFNINSFYNDIIKNANIKTILSNDEIENIQARVANELGFKLVDHRLELYGVKKKHIVLKHLGWHEYPSSCTFGTPKQMFPFPKVVNPGCYEIVERFN